MSEDGSNAVVLDLGTGDIKAGYAGDDAPRAVFPTIYGEPKIVSSLIPGLSSESYYIGDEAISKRGVLKLSHPIRNGYIDNFEHMEKVLEYTFHKELRVQPDSTIVCLTESPMNTKLAREKLTTIMFERFNVPSFDLNQQSVLALYAAGKTTGLMIHSGHGQTSVASIYEGYLLPHAVSVSQDISGQRVSDYLLSLLDQKPRDFKFTVHAELEIVRDMKERFGMVELDPERAAAAIATTTASGRKGSSSEKTMQYELPDGNLIFMDDARWQCTELIFDPSLFDAKGTMVSAIETTDLTKKEELLESSDKPKLMFNGFKKGGIVECVDWSVNRCDVDIRRDLWTNIILSGGNTLFPGLEDRLKKELDTSVVPSAMKSKVSAPPERKYSAWMGGSILSSLTTFPSGWLTKDEYDESGPGCIHRRCQ